MVGELSYGSASQLAQLGLLSKDFMDQVYRDVSVEADKEREEVAKDGIAQDIVNTIVSDPTAADVAARVATALPTQEATPEATPGQPININVTGAAPPAPVTPPMVQVPTETPSPAAVQAAIEQKVIQEAAINAQAKQEATRERNLLSVADLQNEEAAKKAADDGNVAAVKEAEVTGYDLQKRGILAEAAAVQKYSKEAADFYGARYEEMGKRAEDVAKQQAEYKAQLDARIQKQLEAVDAYSKLSIDPNRVFANQTTSDKIIGTIAIALGSFGKNGNTAIAAMDKAVKDDIELQKSQIDLEGKKLDANKNLIASMIAVGADYREAEKMAEASMYKRMELKVNEIASNMKSATAQASAQQLIGQLQVKQEAAMNEAVNLAGLSLASQAGGNDLGFDPKKLPKQYQKLVVPGLGIAANSKAANDMVGSREAYLKGIGIVQEIGRLAETYGIEAVDTQVRVRAASLRKQLAGVIKGMETLGALDKGVETFVDGILASDPLGGSTRFPLVDRALNQVRTNPVVTQAKEAEEYFRRMYGSALRSKMVYISPAVRRELLSAPGEERDKALGNLGKDVSNQ